MFIVTILILAGCAGGGIYLKSTGDRTYISTAGKKTNSNTVGTMGKANCFVIRPNQDELNKIVTKILTNEEELNEIPTNEHMLNRILTNYVNDEPELKKTRCSSIVVTDPESPTEKKALQKLAFEHLPTDIFLAFNRIDLSSGPLLTNKEEALKKYLSRYCTIRAYNYNIPCVKEDGSEECKRFVPSGEVIPVSGLIEEDSYQSRTTVGVTFDSNIVESISWRVDDDDYPIEGFIKALKDKADIVFPERFSKELTEAKTVIIKAKEKLATDSE